MLSTIKKIELDELASTSPVSLLPSTLPRSKGHYQLWKRVFDITFALLLLPFLIPFMLLIALLIKLDSRGAVVFVQRRIGLREKGFGCYKFRTIRMQMTG